MTPKDSGTRWREDHNTFATILDVDPSISGTQSFNANDVLEGTELWTAPANGSEVVAGDKWLLVNKRNGVQLHRAAWTAYIHKGSFICDNFQEVTDPDPNPTPVFPESFVLTDPSGKQALYEFARVIE